MLNIDVSWRTHLNAIESPSARSFDAGFMRAKLVDGSMLKITMAKWLTPSGKNLTKENPLKPDYEVNYEKSGTYDPTLDAAMSLINSK